MRRTRLSLFYLAGYLLPTGLALVVQPHATMKLLQAHGDYGDALPRFVGILLLALGIIVAHMIRVRAEAMYPATLAARVVILTGLVGLYLQTQDPFFAVVTAVVAVGFVATLSFYLADRGAKTPR
ncbi:MAG TPA: hypothetical protein VKA01_11080 [Vicinamibacteria bacterium]|nr:hypothetical protein [Vicinamibacteria bacterium]